MNEENAPEAVSEPVDPVSDPDPHQDAPEPEPEPEELLPWTSKKKCNRKIHITFSSVIR